MSQPTEISRDAALRAVGRTVVNFQRLEHNLKLAARLGPIEGTLPKIQRDIARRYERAETLTLGTAIQAWLAYCNGVQTSAAWTPDLFDISVRMTFSLESDAESRKSHAEALRSLLDTRNELIHVRFGQFDWESPEACNALAVELTELNAVISEQVDYVATLLKEIAAAYKQHAEAVMDEFDRAAAISSAIPDA